MSSPVKPNSKRKSDSSSERPNSSSSENDDDIRPIGHQMPYNPHHSFQSRKSPFFRPNPYSKSNPTDNLSF